MILLANTSDDPVLLTGVVLIVGYLLPAIIASYRKHHRSDAVFLVNFFLGWTGFVWLFALAWAVIGKTKQEADEERAARMAMVNMANTDRKAGK